MSDGWAYAAGAATRTTPPRVRVAASLPSATGVPYHDGYAPNPPASTLSPFLFDPVDSGPGWVTAEQAVTVPAYARGLALICQTIASFPLEEWRGGQRVTPTRALLVRPEPGTTRQATMARTVEDLVNYGRAWWRVLDRDATTGKPSTVAYLDTGRVTVDEVGRVLVDGTPARAADLVRFDHDRYGALVKGARILSTALALEAAAKRYADAPAPRTILAGTGDVQLPSDEAAALLDTYLATVRRRGAAYVDNVDVSQVGWSSSELQLTEARQYTSSQVASLLNLDTVWVGANVSGSSVTYTNRQDLYRGLVDLTLRPYLNTVEQRLSADDVTERGRVVRFDLDAFLRGNVAERAAIVGGLYPDLISRDEARALLDLYPSETLMPPGE